MKGFHYNLLHQLEQMPFSVATVWTPDFQDLDLGHGRAYQGVTGTLELDIFIFEFWDCCVFSQSKLDN